MAIRHRAGGDVSTGGNWLSEAGTYHFIVTGADEQPTKRDGSPLDAVCEVELGVLAGTTPGQEEKSFKIIFWNGKPGEEKSQAFATKKLDRFLMATNLLTRQEIEQQVQKDIELQDAVGRQLIATIEKNAGNDGKERCELKFAEIYHVDDPAMKDVPKSEGSLRLIEAKHRWPGGKPAATSKTAETFSAGQQASQTTPSFVDDI